ncbi:phosphate transporter PHO1 homolog 9-like isoform X1 [Cucurbita pepo subsp. pepo]|uniref:phosphate transporter PHO1 homolog 9-like isoform X1 n=1 Tax=Cucurbita pepo subsp. pepo TaxID=3664 RepID=UPI000C9D3089|nr:phosphate transporter PHO1 homolog 9-like isoform X1 [Cucurbita pepo subsp. pepo]XP_023549610.1 phosphate transporter PHO1 homolog 9-like isoform X1 [Cucurbita pepo subsp. pepo]XP_023549611.1 phosphate transporter PHO1 homolog 9-like isoform X1 [Cucurbita pepo subsp. pepo]
MKFGKEFLSQMVPEWQEAYLDYNNLKAILKEVSISRQPKAPDASGKLKRKMSLYRAFSGLTTQRNSPRKQDDAIITNIVHNGSEESYQSMFFMSSDQGGGNEVLFFRELDAEFNKVVRFYKKKVGELTVEAEELSKQMDILVALRIKVEKPDVASNDVDEPVDLAGTAASSTVNSINGRSTDCVLEGRSRFEITQEVETVEEEMEAKEGNSYSRKRSRGTTQTIQEHRPASLDLLPHVRINIAPETPVSTLKYMVASSKAGLSYKKTELRKSEELMTRALIEFYQKLQVLKGYSFLNILAVSKIVKKYDKITSRRASKVYLEMVDKSPLGSTMEVTRLIERVEAVFIKHFANGNRRKGMDILRRKIRREKHGITFFSGVFFGCAMALVAAIIVVIHLRNIFESTGRSQYMDNIFPLYSLFGFIILHLMMYSGNIYFWRRYRVNYSFMFGFKQGTELSHREVFFLSTGLAVLTLACILSHLDMEVDLKTKRFEAITESIPLALLTVLLLIIFCPFDIIFRSSRFFLIRSAFHLVCTPFYKVTLEDFFLADQLTSQVQAFRSLEFYICYYGWGDFIRRSNTCKENKVFEAFYFVVAIIPYWIRTLQCLRRLIEEKDVMHVFNGLKYFSTVIAVAMRTGNDLNMGMTWRTLAAVSSVIATISGTYWDIVCDWGLLRRNSKNPWLRDKLVISNKSVYFAAIVLNILLRLAWMQSVLGFREAPFIHRQALIAIVAVLEIIRRGIWNFFRLENEHLNNVGKYRAFDSVPLPFDYDEMVR